MKQISGLIVLGLALFTVACNLQPSSEKPATLVDEPSVSTTFTMSETTQLLPTTTDELHSDITTSASSATETPTPLATPLFPASQVARSLILSTGTSSDCELPCWHGLRIGISTEDDVSQVLGNLLNPPAGYDFFEVGRVAQNEGMRILNIPGSYAAGQSWSFQQTPGVAGGSYNLYVLLAENTKQVIGIIESMRSHGEYDTPILSQIMTRLGQPDWIYGGPTTNASQLVLFYEEGVGIYLDIPQIETQSGTFICLDDEPWAVDIVLVEPYVSSNDQNGSAVHETWGAPSNPSPYIDEDWGATIEDFIELINSENPCIEVPH